MTTSVNDGVILIFCYLTCNVVTKLARAEQINGYSKFQPQKHLNLLNLFANSTRMNNNKSFLNFTTKVIKYYTI